MSVLNSAGFLRFSLMSFCMPVVGVLLRGGRKNGKVEIYTSARLAEFAQGERDLEAFFKSKDR